MLTRRDAITATSLVAAMALLGGSSWAFGYDEGVIRPPGGQDLGRLTSRCIRCERCREACPEGCITTMPLSRSLGQWGVPYLDFGRGLCTFCAKCVVACPTEALASFDSDRIQLGLARIDKDKCLAWNQADCQKCADSCNQGAVRLDDEGRPYIVASLCNGCGACEYSCPSASFRSYDGNQARGITVVIVS